LFADHGARGAVAARNFSFDLANAGSAIGSFLGNTITFELVADGSLGDLAFHFKGAALTFSTSSFGFTLCGKTGRQVVEEAAAIGQDAPPKRGKALINGWRRGRDLGTDALTKFFEQCRGGRRRVTVHLKDALPNLTLSPGRRAKEANALTKRAKIFQELRTLRHGASDGRNNVAAGLRGSLLLANAERGAGQTKRLTKGRDTAQREVALFFKLLALDVKQRLFARLLKAARCKERIDHGIKSVLRLGKTGAKLALHPFIKLGDALLVSAELCKSLIVGVGSLAGRQFADGTLGAALKFGLSDGLAGAAKRTTHACLLAEAKAFAGGTLLDVAERGVEDGLRVGRHVAGQVGFRYGGGKAARSSNALLGQFGRQGAETAGLRSKTPGSFEGALLVRGEAGNARNGATLRVDIGLEGFSRKAAGACDEFFTGTLDGRGRREGSALSRGARADTKKAAKGTTDCG
jgi:hypothetical protein